MDTREMTVWIVALMLGAAVLFSPVACTMNRQMAVERAIKNGADPISVKCAIESDTSYSPMCVAKALEKR